MKAELTNEGIVLRAQCAQEEEQLNKLWAQGHLHLVCKARQTPVKRWGYKMKRGSLLLTPSLAEWKMLPFGKKHGTGDARRTR